jgi:hypothetical protein
MSLTWEELLDDDTLSPIARAIFEDQLRREQRRTADRARLGEIGLHHRRVMAWQSDSLREFHKLLALQFEAAAWEGRERKPLWSAEATNIVTRKKYGMRKRLAKARREAAAGCPLQSAWLAKHAELIEALERP